MKSLTFSCLLCALNLYFAAKLLRKAKFARGCQLEPQKVAQKLPSIIGKGLFDAEQLSVRVKLTVEIVRKQQQYKSLLDINGEELSGPFTELEDNWIGEEKGMEKRPPIFQIQIEFILTADQECDLGKLLFSYCQRAASRRREAARRQPNRAVRDCSRGRKNLESM